MTRELSTYCHHLIHRIWDHSIDCFTGIKNRNHQTDCQWLPSWVCSVPPLSELEDRNYSQKFRMPTAVFFSIKLHGVTNSSLGGVLFKLGCYFLNLPFLVLLALDFFFFFSDACQVATPTNVKLHFRFFSRPRMFDEAEGRGKPMANAQLQPGDVCQAIKRTSQD